MRCLAVPAFAGWFAALDAGEPRHGFTAWGEGFAEYDVLQDSWNGIGVNTINFGAAAGIEQSLDADNRLGFAAGYIDSHLRIRPQDAYLRDISVGVYGLHRMDGFLFDGEASVSVSTDDTQRAINAGTFTETAHGSGVGYGFGASGQEMAIQEEPLIFLSLKVLNHLRRKSERFNILYK